MRISKHLMFGCMLLILLLLSGCGGANGNVESISKEKLENYVNQLPALKTVYESHHVKFQSSYSNEKEGFLEIRRVGDHASSLSDEEIAALKQSIYEAVGGKFRLNISVYTIGEQPGVAGKITAIDDKGRFLVVSSDKFLDQEKKMPDAAWYAMSDDAKIELEGKIIQSKDVEIGSIVKVWSEGVMLTSFPGQTTGLRLEVTARDSGMGDERGKVTGIEKTGEGVNIQHTVTVDGREYQMLTFAQVWKNGKRTDFSDIQAGENVKLWFAGYSVGPEKVVTKVVIES